MHDLATTPPATGGPDPSPDVLAELAPTGILRAAINLSNFLLVTGRDEVGQPQGVAPDMAREIARRLGVALSHVCFDSPGELADAAGQNLWDIGLIGAEPERARAIAFSPAYCEIEATYLVSERSGLDHIGEVDMVGVRIAVMGRAAYGLWLDRNIRQATLVRSDTIEGAFELFASGRVEALAGLRPGLVANAATLPGTRLLDGSFASVRQAIGTRRENHAGTAFLHGFVEDAKRSGLVASLIERHRVRGLRVAPAAGG